MNDTVTLAMIVKNEAANLKNCLDSTRGQVNEIVIVDTGSTDGTLEIARRYTDNVYSYPWRDDFSAARNFAIARSNCTWILSLDADEVLLAETGNLKHLIGRDKRKEAYLLPINNPSTSSSGEYNRFYVLRLFKNNGRYRFQGKIHEQIVIDDHRVVGVAEGPVINHKILPPRERNRKRERNLALLKKAYSEDPRNHFLQYYLGVEWLMLGKPSLALPYLSQAYKNLTDDHLLFRAPALRYLIICLQSLGKLDEAIGICLEAVERYPEYTDIYYLCGILFEEKRAYRPAINWFSQALKCDTPPALLSHMSGSGSFLACYHLGFCHDMLGEKKTAKLYYEQALNTNPQYIYPVYNLFLNIRAVYGPRYTYDYFKEKGYLERVNLALAVAGSFFTAGYPTLAKMCLENGDDDRQRDEERWFYLGKYSIYSGRLRQGIQYLEGFSPKSNFFTQARIHRTLALLLLNRFRSAGNLAIELWKLPESRCQAYVLITLTRLLEKGEAANCPQKVRETDVAEVACNLLDECSRYLPGRNTAQEKIQLSRLINGLEQIIKQSSPRGHLALAEYYRDKARNEQEFFKYKIGLSGSRT